MKYKEEVSESETDNMLVGLKNALLFLLLVFSLCSAQAVNKTETIYDTIIVKQTVIDTIHRFNPDSLTVALLKDSETFYSNKFNILLGIMALFFAGFGLFNWKLEKETREELKKVKNFENNLNFLKNEINETKTEFENDRKKQKKDSDVMFRLISKRHFDLAIESIKDNNNDFWGYFSNMYLFCYCIAGINLNPYDSGNLHIAYREFEDKCKKDNVIPKNVIQENEPVFYKFVEYLLKLIKHCEDTNQNDYFTNIKPIYNKILAKFSDNTIIEGLEQEIKDSNYDPKDIQEILNLAKLYKD